MRLLKQRVPRLESLEDRCLLSADFVLHWNEILLQSLAAQPPRVPLARNLALVHVAMFDAVNSIDHSYQPYFADVPAAAGASPEAAAAQAGYETMAALYPHREPIFLAALTEDLGSIPDGPGEAEGIRVGQEVARQILALRSDDGSSIRVNYTPKTGPGYWQPTDGRPAENAHVPLIAPFAVQSNSQFRPGPPPPLQSQKYADDFNEVKALGSRTDSARTEDQTQIALLWQLALGNHQIWNGVAQDVAEDRGTSLVDTARVFALLNMALNDGLQTSYESKYHYELWRPLTAVQRADEDGNPDTLADTDWLTFYAATPRYPAYTSNASAIGGACATVLTGAFGKDVSFTIDAADYGIGGVGPRSYADFWQAADEQADARVYGGIHFRFDCEAGQKVGFKVAHYVVKHFLLPRADGDDEMRAAGAAPVVVNQTLRAARVQPLLAEALARWQAAGVDTSALRGIDVRIADLGGLTLGKAGAGVIWLGANAAGWGWFLDATPGDDSEYTTPGDQGESGRMDLLTVLAHEIGHLLGRDHEAGGVMQETLEAGLRRSIDPVLASDIGWLSDADTELGEGDETPGTGSSHFARGNKRR
jgi:hypothetical protein